MIYKHNFSPHNTPIWNCRYVLHKRKSILLQNWLENGIWSVMHLLDTTGNILTFPNFSSKFNITDENQYNIVVKAIPQAVKLLAKNLYQNKVYPRLPKLMLRDCNLSDSKLSNRAIRYIFNKELYPFVSSRNRIRNFFCKKDAEKLRSKFFKLPVAPKAKEIHFKVLNGIYPSADFLCKRFGFENGNCSFCNEQNETTDHIFYECMYTNAFWDDLHHWLSKYIPVPDIQLQNVLFGFIINNTLYDLSINSILILGKYFLHKNRFLKCKPLFNVFHKELCLYFSSLKLMKTRTAVTLYEIIDELNLKELYP